MLPARVKLPCTPPRRRLAALRRAGAALRAALLVLPLACLSSGESTRDAAFRADGPATVPERSGHEATSSHADVLELLAAIEAVGDPRFVRGRFGTSEEGRELPLLIVADPPVATPDQARASGKPVVLVMANIHGGEVEGKEALLALLRDAAFRGGPAWDAGAVILLAAPIYNADGNERFGPATRPGQNGPHLTGQRANARGLDLNRDYLKLESAEARALTALFNAWDPHVIVDCHATNGSAHGYELTWSPPLNPGVHPELLDTLREDWLPTLRRRLAERRGRETFDYGNFERADGAESDTPDAVRGWRSFDHRPRFGNNTVGLRNRLAILSEAYSYADFATRIGATRDFVLEILTLVSERGGEVVALCERWDRETAQAGAAGRLVQPVGAQLASRGVETLRLQAVVAETDVATGQLRKRPEGPVSTAEVPVFAHFEASATAVAPRAYLLPPQAQGPDRAWLALDILGDWLEQHGLRVERLAEPTDLRVEVATLASTSLAEAPFEGHRLRRASWSFTEEVRHFPAGSLRIPLDQPLARMAFQILDPSADDGLVVWNRFDALLEGGPGAELPVYAQR